MTDVKYNFDEKFKLRNKSTQNIFTNDVAKKKILLTRGTKTITVADFCITDLVWNDSSKDIDKITLNGASSTEYTLSSNHAALKNRIFSEAIPSDIPSFVPSSPDKKFMYFGVNSYLYEFILLIVKAINDETLPLGLETVTLAITATDTETLTNGTIVVTAKDESNTAIQGLTIKGKVGTTTINGTTNSSGQVSVTLEAAGTYAIEVESEATTSYKSASKTGSVTVSAITQGGD